MAYYMRVCKTYNYANAGSNLIFWTQNNGIGYLDSGYYQSSYSTDNGSILYNKSCAHNTWNANTQTYTIVMDNALRSAILSKENSGGLVNITNYISHIPEFQGKDMNGNNTLNIFGYICRNRSVTGGFDATNYEYWEGDWPYNYPVTLSYSYNIPGIGHTSDSIMIISDGWYTRGDQRRFVLYNNDITSQYSEQQLLSPPSTWKRYDTRLPGFIGPFDPINVSRFETHYNTLGFYTINGIYSRNAGTRNVISNNAADVILNAGNTYFGGLGQNDLVRLVGAPNKRCYAGNAPSITNDIIMAITDINYQNNTITVKFAFSHDKVHSMIGFITGNKISLTAMRIQYNFPITTVHNVTDSWHIQFINKSDFNPNAANGSGSSAVMWDSATNSVVLSAGSFVNNSNGFSKIISRSSGVLSCSCTNVNNITRLVIGGMSITIPSNVRTFDVRIICTNNGNVGYWRITAPTTGFAHSFTISYPATENAPIVSFENELYTAIVQSFNDIGMPKIFEISAINNEYAINVSGIVRCDLTTKDGKKYHTISIYDINGDFSRLLVKNGTYVTMPITMTVDVQIVNNTILIKAGMASIGFTNTSIGDVIIDSDAIATLLPAVASVSKNGSRIGYATTTVNQHSFAFSFTALKDEVEQTDDFVSHYLQ